MTTLRAKLKSLQLQKKRCVLVYWPEEDCTTVVEDSALKEPCSEAMAVGKMCLVKLGKQSYSGLISGIGSKEEMEKLEEEVLQGTYNPLQDSAGPLTELTPNTGPVKKRQKTGNTATAGKGKENVTKKKVKTARNGKRPKGDKPTGTILRVSGTGASTTTPLSPTSITITDGDHTNSTEDVTSLLDTQPLTTNSPVDLLSPDQTLPSLISKSLQTLSDMDLDESATSSSDSSDAISESDPLLLEITVECLGRKVEKLESRLAFLEQLLPLHLRNQSAPQPSPYSWQSPQPFPYSWQSPSTYQHNFPSSPLTAYNQSFETSFDGCEQWKTPGMWGASQQIPSSFELATHTPSSVPACNPVKFKQNTDYIPSSAIDRTKLKTAQEILQKYPTLRFESKLSRLAVRLARESVFGDAVLVKCTVGGYRDFPALPLAELNELKQTLFSVVPQYWSNPIEFECVWTTCAESIGQAAKGLRKKGLQ